MRNLVCRFYKDLESEIESCGECHRSGVRCEGGDAERRRRDAKAVKQGRGKSVAHADTGFGPSTRRFNGGDDDDGDGGRGGGGYGQGGNVAGSELRTGSGIGVQ